jgi:hypothetical protein
MSSGWTPAELPQRRRDLAKAIQAEMGERFQPLYEAACGESLTMPSVAWKIDAARDSNAGLLDALLCSDGFDLDAELSKANVPLLKLEQVAKVAAQAELESAERAMAEAEYNRLAAESAERERQIKLERAIQETAERAAAAAKLVAGGTPATPIEVYTPLQIAILNALDDHAMKTEQLANKVSGGDTSRFYKPGGLDELRDSKRVEHRRGIGFFRPDAPPESLILPKKKSRRKVAKKSH